VQGDARTYEHPAALWFLSNAQPDWDVVQACAIEAANHIPSVNRAVFSPQPLEGEDFTVHAQFMDRTAVKELQEIDSVVRAALEPVEEVWQVPVVSLPIHSESGNPVYVIRPVTSRDAMTADFYRMPFADLEELSRSCQAKGAGLLLLDVTSKPPGTIEWE
jgi:GMP synthase (glutamine-hydrolysing)